MDRASSAAPSLCAAGTLEHHYNDIDRNEMTASSYMVLKNSELHQPRDRLLNTSN